MKKLLLVLVPCIALLIFCVYRIQKSKEDFEKPSQVVEDAIREYNERHSLDSIVKIHK